MNIESSRQAWIEAAESPAEQNRINLRQSIRRVRLRMILAVVIASLALVAVTSGVLWIASDGLDPVEMVAWGLIAATLVTLIGLIMRAHGVQKNRQLPVFDHVEANLARAVRLEDLTRNLRALFWAPMLLAFILLAVASDYRHWTDYTFAATSIGIVIWGLLYGRNCVLTRIEADRQALQEQASQIRRIESEGGAQ